MLEMIALEKDSHRFFDENGKVVACMFMVWNREARNLCGQAGLTTTRIMEEMQQKKPTRILCLEDNLHDRAVLEMTLTTAGLDCEFSHSKTREDFESAIEKGGFDLIISDFSLPGYDGMAALAAARKSQPETPFIFVSGTLGEERAIESLQNGATDYVLKDRRERLVAAVRRALRDTQERARRKQLEEELRQAQKMEAIGQLAGGVAHDFNNILSVIQGNAELALMTLGSAQVEVRENLYQIAAASKRAANLTRQLLAFSRKQAMRLQPVNLNDAVENLARMLERVIGPNVTLQCDYDASPVFIRADTGMLDQVILNLVVNSRDAMPQGGRVSIVTRKAVFDRQNIPPHAEARAGEFASLKVGDTGSGISPENLPHIFEPFFTTKEVGKGTGMGLATVYGIVKQHNGWVNLVTQVGTGTTFEILLPAIPPPLASLAIPVGEPSTRRGTGRILLVEDEPAVRSMTRQTLEFHGYEVVEAASGREALEVWQNRGKEIDLLLTDMVMPGGVSGSELAARLRCEKPALKIVFVSGYSPNVIGLDTDFYGRESNCFLQKPYPSDVLLNAIRNRLDEMPTPGGT